MLKKILSLRHSRSFTRLSSGGSLNQNPKNNPWWQRPVLTLILHALIVVGLLGFIVWSQVENLDFLGDSHVDFEVEEVSFKPLDSLSSSDIAHSLANLGRFREISWVEIQSYNSQTLFTADIGGLPIIAKPAIIDSTIRTRNDISQYIVSDGDTVISLANYFNVSADSIRWSNEIRGNALRVGATIVIPPQGLNGVVRKIEEADTVRSLSEQYSFSSRALKNFNDLDSLDSLPTGEFIFLPGAVPATIQAIPDFLGKAIDLNSSRVTASQIADCFGCEPVDAGDTIGKLGNTGWSTGPHLHLEIITYDGRHYNPWAFINQNKLTWPVDQKQRRVTQIYHSGHRGLDISHDEGSKIFALEVGEIIHRGCMWEESNIWSTFGVIIDHGNYYSLYIHLQAPNNEVYNQCSINRRSQYGSKSIDYSSNL